MKFDFSIIVTYWPDLLRGLGVTAVVSLGTCAVGMALGLVIGLARVSGVPVLNGAAIVYVAFFRNVPSLILIFLFYYMLPFYGIRWPELAAGILVLGLYAAAYYGEVLRAAILAVPRGQSEAAIAFGMSFLQRMRHIVLPQAARIAIPPITNTTISMIKETSLLSTITVTELTMAGLIVQGKTFSPVEVFFAVGVLYWVLTGAVARLFKSLEVVANGRWRGNPAVRTPLLPPDAVAPGLAPR